MIKVAIYDDSTSLRDSLEVLLKNSVDLQMVGSFSDCRNLISDIRQTQPDVVIIDVDMDGTDKIMQIRKNYPAVNVLMQTDFENEEKIFAAIRAGAGGCILKSAQSVNLLESIREVFNGGAPLTPGIARKVLMHFQADLTVPIQEDYHLSIREKEVLALLVKGYSYKTIADELYITYATVRAHMTKIYEKLHVSSMTEAVAKAINQKLIS